MNKNSPIGFFDSGVGGLTVVKEIFNLLPNETVNFLADTKNCPYGEKTQDEIIGYAEYAVEFLIKQNVKLIVIACNTATAAALEYLQEKYTDISIIGVITAGSIAAVKHTKNKNILVLGTKFTIGSNAYDKEILSQLNDANVFGKACPSFVPFIENDDYTNESLVVDVLNNELGQTKNIDVDTVILGCTHYPIIKKDIEKYYNYKAKVVSSGEEIAKEILKMLTEKQLMANKEITNHRFFLTGKNDNFKHTAEKWLGIPVEVEYIGE